MSQSRLSPALIRLVELLQLRHQIESPRTRACRRPLMMMMMMMTKVAQLSSQCDEVQVEGGNQMPPLMKSVCLRVSSLSAEIINTKRPARKSTLCSANDNSH